MAHSCDQTSLAAALEAGRWGIFTPVLAGPERRIRQLAHDFDLDLDNVHIVDTPHSRASAQAAVAQVQAWHANLLMKGSLHTDELMSAILNHNGELRTERRISHVFIMDVPSYPGLLFITDAAINIFPDLETKADIIRNVIDLHVGLGLGAPRVAILSAVEQVSGKIPSTLDAAALCKTAERGQIEGGILDGPLYADYQVRIKPVLA